MAELTDEELRVAVKAMTSVPHWFYYTNIHTALRAAFEAVETERLRVHGECQDEEKTK